MRYVSLLQLGVGQVGAAVARLIHEQAPTWRVRYAVDVQYSALADSSGFALPDATARGTDTVAGTLRGMDAALAARASGERFASLPGAKSAAQWTEVLDWALAGASDPGNLYVLDCATGPDTTPLLLAARAAGARIVLANKDPLTGPMAQFRALTGTDRFASLRCSATVGAGLPVLATLAGLVASGDTLRLLDARASGSLGFLCDQLSQGQRFDVAVRAAVAQGYTEPDPRLDLSGFDVARKLLILARVAGFDRELSDVRVDSLVPPGAETLDRAAFLASLDDYGDHLASRVSEARSSGRVLRYVGRVTEDGQLSASLVAIAPVDPLALGGGPENVFRLRSTRYGAYPLTISGPGAGVAVTAGAVVADLLRSLEVLPC